MLRFLKRLVVFVFVVFVGLVMLGLLMAPNPTPTAENTQKAEPSNKRVEKVARQFYDEHESRILKANPDASKRTWNGTYQIRPYPDSKGAWVVDFVNEKGSQWSMVIACENEKWGLARLLVKGKKVYEDPEIHFDNQGVWHLE